jgi:hypothetical protein
MSNTVPKPHENLATVLEAEPADSRIARRNMSSVFGPALSSSCRRRVALSMRSPSWWRAWLIRGMMTS